MGGCRGRGRHRGEQSPPDTSQLTSRRKRADLTYIVLNCQLQNFLEGVYRILAANGVFLHVTNVIVSGHQYPERVFGICEVSV